MEVGKMIISANKYHDLLEIFDSMIEWTFTKDSAIPSNSEGKEIYYAPMCDVIHKTINLSAL